MPKSSSGGAPRKIPVPILLEKTPADVIGEEFSSGSATSKTAAAILVKQDRGFVIPSAAQKKNLVVGFAKRGMVIYGKAFDIVRFPGKVDLDILEEVERNLDWITIYEIKSTRKPLRDDFLGFFFALTAAEILVAQSLKKRFKFIFVNIKSGAHLELTMNQIFGRAKGIYPTWSVLF